MRDDKAFVKSQTPTQLFAKAPNTQGKIVATRPNERWVIEFNGFYCGAVQGLQVHLFVSRHLLEKKMWAKATKDKGSDGHIEVLRSLFAGTGKPKVINADGEFNSRAFNRFLGRQGISARYKQGRDDLATPDAAMNNFKKMIKK